MKTKKITQQEYDTLPGNGAAAILYAIGEDGQPILKYAKCEFKSGGNGIVRYWINNKGVGYQRASKFIPNKKY